MHTARQTFIQSESSDRIRCALKCQTRISGDVHYFTGDIVYYKRKNNCQWHGSGIVIKQNDKQIFVNHGSVYVHVHACRITHPIDNDNNNGSLKTMKMNKITKRTLLMKFQKNSNLENISQSTKSMKQLSLDTNANNQIPLTHNSDKVPNSDILLIFFFWYSPDKTFKFQISDKLLPNFQKG